MNQIQSLIHFHFKNFILMSVSVKLFSNINKLLLIFLLTDRNCCRKKNWWRYCV